MLEVLERRVAGLADTSCMGFPPTGKLGRLARLIRQGHRTIYERWPLEDELLRIFGETTFGEAKTRLCIQAFEGRHGEPWIFKTPHHPDYKRDRHERMVRLAMSTAAAPTFFEALPNNGNLMVDGGIWANNPIMNALVDALACYDIDRAQIEILSLGCGETTFKVDRARGGLLHWNVIRAAMRDSRRPRNARTGSFPVGGDRSRGACA